MQRQTGSERGVENQSLKLIALSASVQQSKGSHLGKDAHLQILDFNYLFAGYLLTNRSCHYQMQHI